MQEKRSAFPRFYFIGDDDLLEILGQATNPTVIQSHLKKLFAGEKLFFISVMFWQHSVFKIKYIIFSGIHSVVFDEKCQHIVAMCSLEGETVPLQNLIRISSLVEVIIFSVLKTKEQEIVVELKNHY